MDVQGPRPIVEAGTPAKRPPFSEPGTEPGRACAEHFGTFGV